MEKKPYSGAKIHPHFSCTEGTLKTLSKQMLHLHT